MQKIDPHLTADNHTPESQIDEFIDWIHSRKDRFYDFSLRTLVVNGQTQFRTTVGIKSKNKNHTFIGCGRSTNPKMSVVKACAEAIERYCMDGLINDQLNPNEYGSYTFQNDQLILSDEISKPKLPSFELMTSNGWAVHFEQDQSLRASFIEAIERHVLTLSFFKPNDIGFMIGEQAKFGGYDTASYISGLSFLDYLAGMVVTKSLKHFGYGYGYMACPLNEIIESSRWVQALFESVEPLYFFDELEPKKIVELQSMSSDFLERRQFKYLLSDQAPALDNVHFDLTRIKKIPPPKNFTAFFVQIDISKYLDMPFKMHASYVFSDSMFPLWPQNLSDSKAKSTILNLMDQYSISKAKIDDEFPIL